MRLTDMVKVSVLSGTLLLGLVAPLALNAQGTLSTQGFGYPVGALSIRSNATGGAFGEFDAASTLNPSALGGMSRSVISAQIEPEYRTLSIGTLSEKNRIQRVPLVLVAFPLVKNGAFSVSAATFLDRSFSAVTNGSANLGDEVVATNDEYHVRGSMSDLRAAAGFRLNERLAVGVAGHVIMGSNNVAFARRFSDSVRFGPVVDSSLLTFQGNAITIGADARILRDVAVSASYRVGNSLEASTNGTVLGKAKVPSRLGATLRYEGIRGSVFAAGVEQISWSQMDGLGTAAVNTHDATNYHVGAEVDGPQIKQLPVQFRAGYAKAVLPFGVAGNAVNEQRITAGMGLPLDFNFGASLDFSVQRVSRSLAGTSGMKENAWRLGIGVQIRP